MKQFTRCPAIILSLILAASCVIFPTAAEGELPETKSPAAVTAYETNYSDYAEKNKYNNASEEITAAVVSTDGETVNEKEIKLKKENSVVFSLEVKENAAFNIKLSLGNVLESADGYRIKLLIDGALPFGECSDLLVSSVWEDDGDIRTLPSGDEIAPVQKHTEGLTETLIIDSKGLVSDPYVFSLSGGAHTLTVTAIDNEFILGSLKLVPVENPESYAEVSKKYDKSEYYTGKQIVIEGEKSLYRTSSSLIAKSDRTSASVAPSSPLKSLINYVGGESWSKAGDTIAWKVDVPEDGIYKLGFSFKQNFVTNGKSFRNLKIDGKTPFAEAAEIGFDYGNGWQFESFCDKDKNDYLFYLTKGEHELSLTATLSNVADVIGQLNKIVGELGDLYLDIIMITGESPDANRDYELHKQIPEFVDVLKTSKEKLEEMLKELSGGEYVNEELSGSMRNMIRILNEMTSNLYSAHLQITSFSSAQQTLSAWLYDLSQMPLSIDQIILAAPEEEFDTPQVSFFKKLKFSAVRFFTAFTKGYSSESAAQKDNDRTIKLWVNWGRDQVKVLSNMIYSDFVPNTGINVVIEQVNATLVQGIISNNSPDLYLHLSRSQPVNYAMRDVVYNLSNFDDLDEVLSANFQEGSEIPYMYRGGCYALPDTQQFDVMFYRKDIFEKLGLKVPETWDDFISTTAALQRNKMNVYLPYTKLAASGTVNVGVGGLTFYPTLLMQMNGEIYNDEQNKTVLQNATGVKAFTFWTDFYTRYGLDPQANFYNKFRAGVYPLGVSVYSLCFTLSAGAPELDGKWGIAAVPGTKQADGSINRKCAGSGTGCSIMQNSKNKEAAWEFIKWWVSTDTQYRYSSEVEAILGETARVHSANINAVKKLSWDSDVLEVIMSQWANVNEVPEIPGSYYVARSIDQAFWATRNGKSSPREAITEWSKISDVEIARKIEEYSK